MKLTVNELLVRKSQKCLSHIDKIKINILYPRKIENDNDNLSIFRAAERFWNSVCFNLHEKKEVQINLKKQSGVF